mmetsp:Transcript_36093/g.66985  ORF Transcript_36093/g.66985 Transcript_36093/m.66985 type:complete len:278 (+) Transcript_36093:1910-2743(+)
MILIQTFEGETEISIVHLALRQTRGDEVVPVNRGLAFPHPHRIEDIDHLLLGEPAQASRRCVPDQNLLERAQRDFSSAVLVVLFEFLSQALNLLRQQRKTKDLAKQLPHVRVLLEPHQRLDNIRIDHRIHFIAAILPSLPHLEPFGFLRLSRSGPGHGVDNQEAAYEVLGLGADVLPRFRRLLEVVGASEDVVTDLAEGFGATASAEGRVAAQEEVRDDTNRPNITLLIIAPPNDLRRHRIWRPHRLVMDLPHRKMLAQSKIHHLQLFAPLAFHTAE